jgi:uroporphyrin-3 C-methyltransferase
MDKEKSDMSKNAPAKKNKTEKSTPKPAEKRRSFPHRLTYSLIVIIAIVLCIVAVRYLFKLQEMTYQKQQMHSMFIAANKKYHAAQEANSQLDKRLQVLEKSLGTVEQSRTQAMEKWKAIEAEYLVSMANDALYFNRNVPMAVSLLKQANADLANRKSVLALNTRKVLNADLLALKKVKLVDSTEVYLQLNTIASAIHQLPLMGSQYQKDSKENSAVKTSVVLHDWHYYWNQSIEKIKHLVVVRHNEQAVIPVISQEQRDFYYQFVLSKLSQAEWAIQHNDDKVFHASLNAATKWIRRYFIVTNKHTESVLDTLTALNKKVLEQRLPKLDQSLAAMSKLNAEGGGAAHA